MKILHIGGCHCGDILDIDPTCGRKCYLIGQKQYSVYIPSEELTELIPAVDEYEIKEIEFDSMKSKIAVLKGMPEDVVFKKIFGNLEWV